MRVEKGPRFADRDLTGLADGVAVDSAADRRKSDGAAGVLARESQALAVARGEEVRLAAVAATPDGTHGVDHDARLETVAEGDARLAGRAAAEPPALLEEAGSGGAVNRAVHAAAPEERGVRGVHDRVDVQRRDVSADDPEAGGHGERLATSAAAANMGHRLPRR